MADPLTVLSIIHGLGKTSAFCYQIIKRTYQAPDEIKRLNAEASNWRPQLESLAELLDEASPSAARLKEKFNDGGLLDVKNGVDELNKILEPYQKLNPWKKLKWSITTGDHVKELLKQLSTDMGFVLGILKVEISISLKGIENEIRKIQLFETSKFISLGDDGLGLTAPIDEHERRNILEWLKPKGVDAHEFHRQKRALREEGTCDWLAESGPWKDWCEGGSPINARFLWIHGLPGAGKTVLASFGIDHVAAEYQHKGVSYYYCSHERHKKGHTSSEEACSLLRWVIRDLTAQVTRPKTRTSNHQAIIPKTLEDLYVKHDFSVKNLLECLLAVTQYIAEEFQQQVCIIVDAVDESPSPRDVLLDVLTTIGTDPAWHHVSLCFTSRKETDITVAIEAIQSTTRRILIPKGPSRGLGGRGRKSTPRSGFDGMPPPPIPEHKSRSECRMPSGDMSGHYNERERSMSMGPGEESLRSGDPMEVEYTGSHGLMKGCTIISMDDHPDVIRAIRTFVQSQLQDNQMFRGWNEDQLKTIIEQLARKAKGILQKAANGIVRFRWAACQVDIIMKSRLRDMDSILRMLNEIPPDIFGTYEHMIMHLLPDGGGRNEHNRNFARTALALICSPTSRVSCAEVLVEASRFDVPHGAAHMFDLRQLEEILGCLITVTPLARRPETMYNRDEKGPTDAAKQVSVAHYTVKEYLFDKSTALGNAKDFALSIDAIQTLELQVIFNGLQQFGTNRPNGERYPTRYEEYCLKMTDKALKERRDLILQNKSVWKAVTECLKWNSAHHLPKSGAFPNMKIRAAFSSWTRTSPFEPPKSEQKEPKKPETSVLVSLLLLQWPELAELYLAELPDATKKAVWRDRFELAKSFKVEGTNPTSLMQLCVTRRDVAFLQALIDSKADFSGEGDLVMDLFYHAYGHKSLDDEDGGAKTGQMLKMLLERGVRPEAPGYIFTPLQFAVHNLEDAWVHDLLYEGADPNAIGSADGVHPFGESEDEILGHLTPLEICKKTRPKWLQSTVSTEGVDNILMENARQTVEFSLRQWGAEDEPVVIDLD
ncbi:hypothetical protein N8I77_005385 [Diaporthe amygdali]|uniref:Nephrocystin 3-like N-terminal domain-containing protein n=1 Tax=Phomopsis amygdali TaxID=1214568 RepID=A0AAD9W2W3_PHOAM|nr:hypothetical protein N8I77_005385 [Diaporthe amygdali]